MDHENYDQERAFSDSFAPEIERILLTQKHLLYNTYDKHGKIEADFYMGNRQQDNYENTDFWLKSDGFHARVSARIRRFRYWKKYHNDVTFRVSSPIGEKIEWAKMLDGLGDFNFYGFATQDESAIYSWSLLDLTELRKILEKKTPFKDMGGQFKRNTDGTGFLAIPIDRIGPAVLLSRREKPSPS